VTKAERIMIEMGELAAPIEGEERFLVCGRGDGGLTIPGSEEVECADCQKALIRSPAAPREMPVLCVECAILRSGDFGKAEVRMTPEQFRELCAVLDGGEP